MSRSSVVNAAAAVSVGQLAGCLPARLQLTYGQPSKGPARRSDECQSHDRMMTSPKKMTSNSRATTSGSAPSGTDYLRPDRGKGRVDLADSPRAEDLFKA